LWSDRATAAVTVTEIGGDDKQIARLTKELRTAAQKAKSESNSRSASTRRHSQRWTSTDEDYLPDKPKAWSVVPNDLRTRSRTNADLGSRSQADGDSLSRQRRRSDLHGNDDDVTGDSLRRTKTDVNRPVRTGSPRE